MIDKSLLIDEIVRVLNEELTTILSAAKFAREAATHEESKPEDQYDTRGLEASYLAGAQSERALQIERLIAMYKQLPVTTIQSNEQIGIGSLIEIESNRKRQWYFLVQQGGGISVTLDGKTILVITPSAPLGEAIFGKKSGELVEVEVQNKIREYHIITFF